MGVGGKGSASILRRFIEVREGDARATRVHCANEECVREACEAKSTPFVPSLALVLELREWPKLLGVGGCCRN